MTVIASSSFRHCGVLFVIASSPFSSLRAERSNLSYMQAIDCFVTSFLAMTAMGKHHSSRVKVVVVTLLTNPSGTPCHLPLTVEALTAERFLEPLMKGEVLRRSGGVFLKMQPFHKKLSRILSLRTPLIVIASGAIFISFLSGDGLAFLFCC